MVGICVLAASRRAPNCPRPAPVSADAALASARRDPIISLKIHLLPRIFHLFAFGTRSSEPRRERAN